MSAIAGRFVQETTIQSAPITAKVLGLASHFNKPGQVTDMAKISTTAESAVAADSAHAADLNWQVLSAASLRALDAVNFFLAATLPAFGPYLPAYLAGQHRTQQNIGFLLTAAALAGLLSQIPAGELLDIIRAKRRAFMLGAAIIARRDRASLLQRYGPVDGGIGVSLWLPHRHRYAGNRTAFAAADTSRCRDTQSLDFDHCARVLRSGLSMHDAKLKSQLLIASMEGALLLARTYQHSSPIMAVAKAYE